MLSVQRMARMAGGLILPFVDHMRKVAVTKATKWPLKRIRYGTVTATASGDLVKMINDFPTRPIIKLCYE